MLTERTHLLLAAKIYYSQTLTERTHLLLEAKLYTLIHCLSGKFFLSAKL
jgi:hypothetical protein